MRVRSIRFVGHVTTLFAVLSATSPARALAEPPDGAPAVGPASTALAAPAPAPPAATPAPATMRWYGWQVMAADVTAVALLSASGRSQDFAAASLGLWGLGGPAIHLAHRRYWSAAGSLGLRISLPLLGAAIGDLVYDSPEGEAHDDGLLPALLVLTGAIGGAGLASIVDWTLLAEAPVPARHASWHLGFVPRAEGGFALAVGGVF